jgi:hypothetical protein
MLLDSYDPLYGSITAHTVFSRVQKPANELDYAGLVPLEEIVRSWLIHCKLIVLSWLSAHIKIHIA